MAGLPRDIASITPPERPDQRRAGRLRCGDLRCSLGAVKDLSATGVLISRRKPAITDGPEGARPIVIWIENPGNGRVFLKARPVRCKRVGLMRHEVAYQFVELTDDKRAALVEIARGSVHHEFGMGER